MGRPPSWLVMPAAGAGRRMADSESPPKQYLPLSGRTVREHALQPFLADAGCVGIVVALAAGDDRFAALPPARDPRVSVVTGGAERADSVAAGLRAIAASRPGEDPWVLVHDAARPCLPPEDLAALLTVLEDAPDGALLALPVSETIKRADGAGRVLDTVPRSQLWRAQTPQAFRLHRLQQGLVAAPQATDEASAVEALGGRPRLVAGSADNLKLTTPGDLALATRLLAGRGQMQEPRVGFGVDVHAFGPGDHVWLGGERIAHSHGLVAHSDGDVVLHALCDALLGAAALGDIGQHFPDTDTTWRGVASSVLVRATVARVAAAGFRVVNADLTLIGERPRLAPHRDAIRANVAGLLDVGVDRVNVKATTTERLGFLGRAEGLAAEVVVLLERAS